MDALDAHLYGLTREELDYLETFPTAKRKDGQRWGEYRTMRVMPERYREVESLTVIVQGGST